jgi:SAM-dependent methyltransferase
MIIPSKPCSFRRYCALIASSSSQARFFINEKLSGLHMPGKAIDIGGTKNSSYHALLRTDAELTTLNISSEHGGGADIIADCNVPLPIENEYFDSLLSVTVLEHVKNDVQAMREALRILKPGGKFHILVPFLFREHGCPQDFHRHTTQWWQEFFLELGLRDEQFTVEPLVWDEFASGASFFEGSFRWLRPFIRTFFCLPGLLAETFNLRKSRAFIDTHALAIYISGRK